MKWSLSDIILNMGAYEISCHLDDKRTLIVKWRLESEPCVYSKNRDLTGEYLDDILRWHRYKTKHVSLPFRSGVLADSRHLRVLIYTENDIKVQIYDNRKELKKALKEMATFSTFQQFLQ